MATNKQSRSKMADEKDQRCLFEFEQDLARSDGISASMAKHAGRNRRRRCWPVGSPASVVAFACGAYRITPVDPGKNTPTPCRAGVHFATGKEFYTTAEVAQILGKRPYTVREWCRLGRVRGDKAHSGRGLDEEWRVWHEELMQIQNEGPLGS